MNWEHLVPHDVAVRQAQWERRDRMLRMHEAGLTYKEIARRNGISASVAFQHVYKAAREWRYRSPVERWMNDDTDAKRLFQYLIAPPKPPRVPRVLSAAAQEKAAQALRRAGWDVAPPT